VLTAALGAMQCSRMTGLFLLDAGSMLLVATVIVFPNLSPMAFYRRSLRLLEQNGPAPWVVLLSALLSTATHSSQVPTRYDDKPSAGGRGSHCDQCFSAG
jgi:hypothetical protein